MSNIHDIRLAINEALPHEVSAEATELRPSTIYFPPSHIKALRMESSLVVGGRGVGKTFWTKVLSAEGLRATLVNWMPDVQNVDVRVGFSAEEDIEKFPVEGVFKQLLGKGFDAKIIWTAVLVRWLASITGETIPTDSWLATAQWVQDMPELEAKLLQNANETLRQQGKRGLIVFDALDRTSDNDWGVMNTLVSGLLKVILRLKSTSALFGKVFLREDQFTSIVVNFPDASKLQATRCDLTWQFNDLHGLLWSTLCNAPGVHGELLRTLYKQYDAGLTQSESIYRVSSVAMRQGEIQKSLFHALTGSKMGTDTRRGVPYIWTVSHLADSNQRTSPRSFLAALQVAAMDSLERYPAYEFPLHYESIKRGVQRASQIRVKEMSEDYLWVEQLFAPLAKQFNVPVVFSVIEELWQEAFPAGLEVEVQDKLPPEVAAEGWHGILKYLEHLGMCASTRDGRINMPDLYRVAFNIGRRGGVKPVTSR